MNGIDLSKSNTQSSQDLIILKFSVIGCVGLALIGFGVFTFTNYQNGVRLQSQATGKPEKGITPTQPSEQPLVVIRKPQKPIIVEEGSEAWFCLNNNGGDGCLDRERFAPNYKIVTPPRPQKTYEDYLVQYGVRSGDCGRYLNGRSNCF
ncbi:hypothetical protein [Planktothrix mougeotii]|uniref:Uncharacterized protein n=1 Tax=Planktothrix mougeotii LEGE 06226 TaxID=1828728 RepID=A0ABR9UEI3_9CYAN|nr:hypothetical protein [Planktothrix mougeotii]MBE9144877.1 hypothetical protein [Planktothrix mougeotii LEGE 06226]